MGVVDRYCLYEVGGEVIIEYWRGKEVAAKLIHADNSARALMNCCNAEKTGFVRCFSIS